MTPIFSAKKQHLNHQQYNETQEIEADAKKVKKDSTKKTMVEPDALNVDMCISQ